ncbi:MAG: hypothetical protein AB7D27_08840 [Desulfomicrobium sp.]
MGAWIAQAASRQTLNDHYLFLPAFLLTAGAFVGAPVFAFKNLSLGLFVNIPRIHCLALRRACVDFAMAISIFMNYAVVVQWMIAF